MPDPVRRRAPMLAWWIGLVIILVVVAFVAYRFACMECAPPGYAEFMVLGILPAIYLVLMYVTLKSQARSEETEDR
jgi:uncharacterized membrane protein